MGHIDHGKSSLLDYIRKTNVVGGEVGGITQHLGAYEVVHTSKDGKEHRITFLDTPGHEAFKGIRERGATVADIAILVVSGEEGVKPQTLEALNFIKKTKVPYIIAITKIDKPSADVERTKQNMAEKEIYVEGYGGDIPFTAVSAKSGAGIEDLLDLILLVAEMQGVGAKSDGPLEAYVIEADVDKKKGIGATVIVKSGTLSSESFVVAEKAFASARRLENFLGKPIKAVLAGMPARIIGWNIMPRVGSKLEIVKDKSAAEECIETQTQARRKTPDNTRTTLLALKTTIPLIIKADAGGSLEALEQELAKLSTDKIAIKIIHKGLGEISERDVKVAVGSPDAVIVGFNVGVDAPAKGLIERSTLTLGNFDIIYKLILWVAELVKNRTPKVKVETVKASVKILKIFNTEKDRQIIGGKVIEGELTVGDEFKIWRREAEVGRGKVRDLQRFKAKTELVPKDSEFGASVTVGIELMPGDRIEAVTIVEE